MAKEESPSSSPPSPSARRSSFAPGQKFSELFIRPGVNSTYPGSIAAAAANAQRQQGRRMSISTMGLSGSPTQPSVFASPATRRESGSSSGGSGSPSHEESAVEEGDPGSSHTPSSPFARRMSFGARALRDARAGSGNTSGEGFNWSEQLRSRAERSSSITSPPVSAPLTAPRNHERAASIATMEPPVKEMPQTSRAPDYMQERILKGDFYMD